MRGLVLACSEFIRSSLQQKAELKSKEMTARDETQNTFVNQFLLPVVTVKVLHFQKHTR